MRAVLEGRDSLVVLPTGGGKSLCYQAPAVFRGDTTVVVSPLISLMKDQVDSLKACGVAAIQLDSSQSAEERFNHEVDIREGKVRLLFVSPERLVMPHFQSLLQSINIHSFAIDEAHCISHWGHDFRPEYRQLRQLKDQFPKASLHAYTATATERVRSDIVEQLGLRKPEVLVGSFDRPNLAYRVLPRFDEVAQTQEIIDRHKGEAGIIYCIRRKDVDGLTEDLRKLGYQAMPYHAGMDPDERRKTQDAFSDEKCDLVIATVAFGMGIDRSNIRFIIHTGMPKSVEHYQQETGRAGRDGLEAECILLYSAGDLSLWKFIIEKSAEEANAPPEFVASARKHLNEMNRYATDGTCRHRALVQYFGQKYPQPSCQACDLCLGDCELVPDATMVAMKILSCVARVKESFGVNHVANVLRGLDDEKIRKYGHHDLSTFGLLKEHDQTQVRNWVQQLVGQGLLTQTDGEYPVLKLNASSWEVMKKERTVKLVQPMRRKKEERPGKSKADAESWEGVDRELFDDLKGLRRELAETRNVPPYIIFSDATLREMARYRPSTLAAMHLVYGVGEAKLEEYGQGFLGVIHRHRKQRGLALDIARVSPAGSFTSRTPRVRSERRNRERTQVVDKAFRLFAEGAIVEDVMHQVERSRSWVVDELSNFIRETRPGSIATWVPPATYQQIAQAARQVGSDRLKPIHVALGEKVDYDLIRLVLAHLAALEQ